jgi:hypothetical protein
MANINGAFGLRPYGMLGSAPNSTGVTEYRIASTNTNKIYKGMAVIPTADGVIDDLQAAAGGTVSILLVLSEAIRYSVTPVELVAEPSTPYGRSPNAPLMLAMSLYLFKNYQLSLLRPPKLTRLCLSLCIGIEGCCSFIMSWSTAVICSRVRIP